MSDLAHPVAVMDGNEAAASVAYQTNEVIAIYPITPSSTMGEWADQWSAEARTNLWGAVPSVVEMQSEGGAAGALHGALQAGSLATTFTSSQGLLLMIPNMYKIAGELTPVVFHVASRAIAAQALSIFGDHQDVMAVRQTGFAMLSAASIQEVMDFALIAQSATLTARVPFLHFFDGFRTSHEIGPVETLTPGQLRDMLDPAAIAAHRARALSPDHPVVRGTAQNPDVYFQGREAVNAYYRACPHVVEESMRRFAQLTGREYNLFDYAGHPQADRVVVVMGSAGEMAHEAIEALNAAGEKVGVVQVRLYRPFEVAAFVSALPETTRRIAVLDRTKEPGSAGEPLYLDIVAAIAEGWEGPAIKVIGGRYGLSSKEFTPAMLKAVFDELAAPKPRNHFTVGIHDDVTFTSLDWDPHFSTEHPDTVRCLFYGLGADGTVGANKNSIKIIAEETNLKAQGYFVYDSKKSGSVTISHLRFGPRPIRAPYLISEAGFIACHQFGFLQRFDVLEAARHGATVLLNSPYPAAELWSHLPATVQARIVERDLDLWTIDAQRVARQAGLGSRINTIMQTCFFALSGVVPRPEAIAAIKRSIAKTYAKRGAAVVEKNYAVVDAALGHLEHVAHGPVGERTPFHLIPGAAPGFVRDVVAPILLHEGDSIPVSRMPVDGTFPTATSKWEKRNISSTAPEWNADLCIQCGKCVLVCPHAVIRAKIFQPAALEEPPPGFLTAPARWKEFGDRLYTLQVAAEDCTGCTLCVAVCPKDKALTMEDRRGKLDRERTHWTYFEHLPTAARAEVNHGLVKDVQLLEPLFEFSGACTGCGETPYIKLVTQLFGDRAVIANATGCSSIFSGNLPTTPYTTDAGGRGPAWANSLFEDNAEFGLGIRTSLDAQRDFARTLLARLTPQVGTALAEAILNADQSLEEALYLQRERVGTLKEILHALKSADAAQLLTVADALVNKSVWILGGDGWAYDIGYGGLDHVLASGRNVNILVLDTEVYSNTGGQMSKSTPRGAVARFAASGKPAAKKDLAAMAMMYPDVYVAHVAFGASDTQTIKALREAESYSGPSLVIAYAHCIAHGYEVLEGLDHQKKAVASTYWPLFRYDPRKGKLEIDSRPATIPLAEFVAREGRFGPLATDPARLAEAQHDIDQRWKYYQTLAGIQNRPA